MIQMRQLTIIIALIIFCLPALAEQKSDADWKSIFSKKAKEYEMLFENTDAKAIANLFQKDGLFTLADGTKLEGRKQIESYYKEYFRQVGPELISVDVKSVNVLVPNSAVIEIGTTRTEASKRPLAKYRVLHVKTAEGWKVAWAEETLINQEYSIKDLEWLVGAWETTGKPGDKIEIEVKPIAKGSFLELSNKSYGHRVLIGINPATNLLHSWHFDSKGGIGEGDWSNVNGLWKLQTLGLTKDGAESRAVYSLKQTSKNKFLWGSSERFMEGNLLPDLEEVELVRVNRGKGDE